jgi:hypothetical protein
MDRLRKITFAEMCDIGVRGNDSGLRDRARRASRPQAPAGSSIAAKANAPAIIIRARRS